MVDTTDLQTYWTFDDADYSDLSDFKVRIIEIAELSPAETAGLKWTLTNNKRHYEYEDFLKAIRLGR